MKLLYCYYYGNLGGVTSVIKSRMEGLIRSGWDVSAAFEMDVGGVADLVSSGVKAFVAPQLRANPSQAITAESYDVISVIDMPEILTKIADASPARLVYEVHTPIESVLQKNKPEHIDTADLVMVPSEWSKQWLRDYVAGPSNDDKLAVVPNLIDFRNFRAGPLSTTSPKPQLLWVGKIAQYKRWRDAMRIAGTASRTLDLDIVLVTGGQMNAASTEDFLNELAANGILERVQWIHNLPSELMSQVYRDCAASHGALLSTSEAESFCLVAHEALACGLPVIAAAAGALPEALSGPLSEFLFTTGDVEGAGKKVVALLSDRERWMAARRLVLGRRKQVLGGPPVELRFETQITRLTEKQRPAMGDQIRTTPARFREAG